MTKTERIRHLLRVIRSIRRTVVKHGDDPDVARPKTSRPVTWLGSAIPTNAIDGDRWERVG